MSAAKRSAATEPAIADRRSIVDWLSADDDIDLATERVGLSLATPDL